jgi:hypothetical protein
MEYRPLAQRAPPGSDGFWDIEPALNLVRRPCHDSRRLRGRRCKWKRWTLRELIGTPPPAWPAPFHRVACDDEAGRQNLHVLARAAKLFHAAFHVGIKRLAGGEVALRREHRFGSFRRQLPADLRRSGLHEHRPALGRPGDIERSSHRETFTLVIEHMHFRWLEENAMLDIADEGVIGPAVSQARDQRRRTPVQGDSARRARDARQGSKLSAASGLEAVTVFQPALSPEI